MRHLKLTSAAAALVIAAVPTSLFIASAAEIEEQTPQYIGFDSNEVNGEIVVEIPDGVMAHISITFDSPEFTDIMYFDQTVGGATTCGFSIEGRDTTEDDFRDYHLNIEVTDDSGFFTEPYTETFNIPDINDNPHSFVSLIYRLSADNKDSKEPWEITKNSGDEKNITFHLNRVVLGDVDRSGAVDAGDASLVLAEYAKTSTTNKGEFSPVEKKAADINGDSAIDASDASCILKYYSLTSTGKPADWSEIAG